MNTIKDELGYTIIADGIDAGRYATPEVATQSYADEVHGLISDLSKDATGHRCRMDFSDASFFQLEMEAEYWASCVERELEDEQHVVEESQEVFMHYAPDVDTAHRWLKEIL